MSAKFVSVLWYNWTCCHFVSRYYALLEERKFTNTNFMQRTLNSCSYTNCTSLLWNTLYLFVLCDLHNLSQGYVTYTLSLKPSGIHLGGDFSGFYLTESATTNAFSGDWFGSRSCSLLKTHFHCCPLCIYIYIYL